MHRQTAFSSFTGKVLPGMCCAVMTLVAAHWKGPASAAAPSSKTGYDVVIAGYEGFQVWFAKGEARFQTSDQGFIAQPSTTGVALGDLDGDGDLDALEANRASPNRLLLNDGKGRFKDSGQNFGSWKSRNIAVGAIR